MEFFRFIEKAFSSGNALLGSLIQSIQKSLIVDSPRVRSLLEEAEKFYLDLEQLRKGEFTASEAYQLKEKYASLFRALHEGDLASSNPKVDRFIRTYTNIDLYRHKTNETASAAKRAEKRELLSDIDGKALDTEQQDAVLSEEENILVIAGAGSGKTLTIAGKVVYIVKDQNVDPSEILLITFTKKAAEEMEVRIVKRLNIPVQVRTFHGLGNEIIAGAKGEKPTIIGQNAYIIKKYFEEGINRQPSFLQLIMSFLGQYFLCPPIKGQFKSLGEYYEAQKSMDMRTLKDICSRQEGSNLFDEKKETLQGEQVKSTEELLIANFLYLNGVEYTYEKPYPYHTADGEHRQYTPDFYLPQADLYLEHFGVDREGNNGWFSAIENRKYQEGILWKRALHEKMKTKLYETYSYEFSEGTIFETLEKDLPRLGVQFKPIDLTKVYQMLQEKESKHFKELKKLLHTFLNLFKSQGYTLDDIGRLEEKIRKESSIFMRNRNLKFLKLFEGLFTYYEQYLKENNAIDFNDMINLAT